MDEDQAKQTAQQAITSAQGSSTRRARTLAVPDEADATVADPAPAEQTRVIPTLDVKLKEFASNSWRAYAPSGTTLDDLSHPRAWMGVRGLRVNDTVEVIGHDFFALVLIVDDSPGRTAISLLTCARVDRPEPGKSVAAWPEGYMPRRCEPGARSAYEVYRPHDRVAVSRGTILATEEDARLFAVKFVGELHRDALRVAAGKRR